jgi:flagellar biosynthesis component FlhA
MLESASRRSPALVADAVPGVISVSALLDLLRSLLRERVCIRDLERVLEAVVRGGSSASPSQRLAAARRSLSGWITRATTTEGRVHAAWVGDGLAARLRADPSPEALAPLDEALAALVRASMPAVVVAPADVRLPLFERLRVRWSPVYVVSPEELASEVTLVIEPAGAPV